MPIVDSRIDAWYAALTDDQQWSAYEKFIRFGWLATSKWVAEEYKIDPPGKNAMYRWKAKMAGAESVRRIEQGLAVKAEVSAALAATGVMDEDAAEQWKRLALDASLNGSPDLAKQYFRMAMDLTDRLIARRGNELKEKGLAVKNAALALLREKFEAAEGRINAAREAMSRLDRSGGISPEARAEIEKAMGLL